MAGKGKRFRWAGLWALTLAIALIGGTLSLNAQESLPPLAVHGPPSWVNALPRSPDRGDYFERVEPSPLGYLLWSRFPVTVYVDRGESLDPNSGEWTRFEQWTQAITLAIADWQTYVPLEISQTLDSADIRIFYREPPLNRRVNPETGLITFGPARTAQARYEGYQSEEIPPRLRHRMTLDIKPGRGKDSLVATARHELGHALGIWGHSDRPEDVLYPSPTADLPPLSPRDLNTLYRLYHQPTRLGWPLPPS